jgi:metal-responsive CopG/Arc/MetJ family transcriptional regulator
MKPVQVLFEDDLLQRLDRDPVVQARGRSAVLRELAAGYLARQREREIDAAYDRGYGSGISIEAELDGWVAEGVWPENVGPDKP